MFNTIGRLRLQNLSSLSQDPHPATILADDAAGMTGAVTESLRLRYRRFGFVDGPAVASNVRRRTTAMRVLEAAGVDRLRIYKSTDGAFAAVARRLVQDRRELVLCFGDQRALKLLSALNRMGVKVPDDVGIIGFDDIPFASISNPPLSTVAVPYEQMGQIGCAMLMEQLSTNTPSASVSLGVQLMLRSTTAARPTDASLRSRRPRARKVQ